MLISAELCQRFPLNKDVEPSEQKLNEFLRVFSPEGTTKLEFERQQENRELYESLKLGAIAPLPHTPQLPNPSSETPDVISIEPFSRYTTTATPVFQSGLSDDMEFETF